MKSCRLELLSGFPVFERQYVVMKYFGVVVSGF